jgi:tetratricopeptide (TPR) repeat protein
MPWVIQITDAQTSRAATSHLARANHSYAKGELSQAIEDYSAAIAFDPNLAVAYVNRGVARVAQNDIAAAIGRLHASD